MSEDLGGRMFRADAMKLPEDFWFPMFDELVWPADAFDGCMNAGGVQVFNDLGAESIHNHVILEGANDLALGCVFLQNLSIKRFDEARIDERDR